MTKTLAEVEARLHARLQPQREERAKRMRDVFPFAAGIVDELRKFGFDPVVKYATQGAHAVGQPGEIGVRPTLQMPPPPKRRGAPTEETE